MGRAYFEMGARFLLYTRCFQIKKEIQPNVFLIEDLEYKVQQEYTFQELLAFYEKGELIFSATGKNTTGNIVKQYDFDDFSMLPEKRRSEADFRFFAISPVISKESTSLNEIIIERVKELRAMGYTNVSRASMYRWIKNYKSSEGDIRSLVASYHKCGPQKNGLSQEIEIIIDQIIKKHYKRRERIIAKTVYELVFYEVSKRNKERPADQQLEYPSLSTIRRRIQVQNQYDLDKARYGTILAKQKNNLFTQLKKPIYPLERVECDHTRLDLMIIDEDNLQVLGRPTLTTILDVCTGLPLGLYIGFEPPSYTAVMHALKHAILPKSYIKEKFPSVENNWDAYGIPQLLVVDNGKEFRSKSFEDACKQLNIEIMYCPVRQPHYKGTVERHFRTINEQLLHQIPGTTFSNILDKGDYNPEKNAVVTFDTFMEMILIFIVDYYAQGGSRKGINRIIPAKTWEAAYKEIPRPALPLKVSEIEYAVMKLENRSIQHTGIQMQHLFYSSHSLKILRSKLRENGKRTTVRFKYDPTDLSKIYVYDEFENKYVEVACTNQEYSKGLNEYTHKLVIREVLKGASNVDEVALARAKKKIIDIVFQATKNLKNKKINMGRAKGIGSDKLLIEREDKKLVNKEDNTKSEVVDIQDWQTTQQKKVEADAEIDIFEFDEEWGTYNAE